MALVMALTFSALAPALADSATQSPPPERKDNVFGTMDENMRMGRDSETGDSFMHIEPSPPLVAPKEELPPIEIRPEIHYPAQQD